MTGLSATFVADLRLTFAWTISSIGNRSGHHPPAHKRLARGRPKGFRTCQWTNVRNALKALEVAVGQIEKQFGKGSIMRLGQRNAISPTEAISTGSISIDFALGIGGAPARPRHRDLRPGIVGQDHARAAGDRRGATRRRAWPHSSMPSTRSTRSTRRSWASKSTTCWSRSPTTANRRSKSSKCWFAPSSVDVVVVDSVAALVPRAEIEGEMGEAQMGLQARLMSQALRKLTGSISKSKTVLIFINQLREKIGVMFGNPETTTGGRALKFYASIRIDIRRIAAIKDGDVAVGGRTRVKVVKNKMAPPFREAEFDIMYGEGISREGDLLDLAVEKRIVEKSGAWFAYGGERLGQGRENVKSLPQGAPRYPLSDRGSRAPRARPHARAGAAARLERGVSYQLPVAVQSGRSTLNVALGNWQLLTRASQSLRRVAVPGPA